MRSILLLFVFSLAAVAPAPGEVIIDDFEIAFTGGTLLSSSPPTAITDTVIGIASSIIGTERFATLTHTSGLVMTATIDSVVEPGSLAYGEVLGEVGSLTLLYDGVGSVGLGSFDITEGGINDKFVIAITAIDTAGTLTITVTDGDSSDSVAKPISVATTPEGTIVVFLFSEYSGIDFTDVESISLSIDGDGTLDLALDYISSVPEPSSLALVGLLLLAGCVAHRRRAQVDAA